VRALLVDPAAPGRLRLGDAPEPEPGPGEVLVGVRAISLNRGEVRGLADAAAGAVPGWDAAGIVLGGGDGASVARGTRVVTFGWSGGWAERRVVPPTGLAALPDDVDLGLAAALPVAGASALRALRMAGDLRGRRLMITGAAGGVGRFALQLARERGARVVAVVSRPERAGGLHELGADEIAVGVGRVAKPVDAVLEAGGDATLLAALERLAPGGRLVSVGGPGVPDGARDDPRVRRLRFDADVAADLAELLAKVAAGTLVIPVGWRGSWTRAGEAARLLLARRIEGKAVLQVDDPA
jgi:NADPH:quinone reductase-like Zn-dependent oxidoreductase